MKGSQLFGAALRREEREETMTKPITRRGFIAGSGVAAASVALAGCSTGSEPTAQAEAGSGDIYAAPDLSSYPIDPDGEGVEALYTTETMRKDKWTKATNPDGHTTVGAMDASRIIQVDGLAFRDMNGNGKLDAWEDWRQDADTRAAELAKTLTAEQCFPLMFAGGTQSDSTSTDTSAFDWIERGSRAGVSRLASSADSYATDVEWINNVQQVCEESELGIPYFNYSDPYVLFNVPSSIGLAATMDKDIWRKAGMWQARAWRASGVRCELGPQVDVYSSNIGTRTSGSVCEDPAVNRDFTAAFGGGMRSTWGDDEATEDLGWGKQSCGVMFKHFVGEGAPDGGRNDHLPQGKWNVFPGSNFKAHLIPFLDGGLHLDSKTEQMASIMPCCGIAYDPSDPEGLGEHVGSAYSSHNMGILRNAGWDGMLCTDWTVLVYQCNGVSDKTEAERFQIMMNNTVTMHGGTFQPDVAEETYGLMCDEMGEEAALAQLQDNVRRLFKLMVNVDLLDNPYSSVDDCAKVFDSDAPVEFGREAAVKCVVMLKNKGGVISETGIEGPVYIPQSYSEGGMASYAMGGAGGSVSMAFDEEVASQYFSEVVTDDVATVEEVTADDITAKTKDELTAAGVKYAVVGIKSPADAYDGAQGGVSIASMIMGAEQEPGPYYKPVTLQYRPFTADQDWSGFKSLNPEDEYGVLEDRSVNGESTHATNESDLDLVLAVKDRIPDDAKLIVCIDASKPMVFSEFEDVADVILLTFSKTSDEPFARIITGEVEPSGLLPFQMPASMETVYNEQYADVPRDMTCHTDSEGNTYGFTFGLNWSGQIDDERVATYNVPALTEPETEVVPYIS